MDIDDTLENFVERVKSKIAEQFMVCSNNLEIYLANEVIHLKRLIYSDCDKQTCTSPTYVPFEKQYDKLCIGTSHDGQAQENGTITPIAISGVFSLMQDLHNAENNNCEQNELPITYAESLLPRDNGNLNLESTTIPDATDLQMPVMDWSTMTEVQDLKIKIVNKVGNKIVNVLDGAFDHNDGRSSKLQQQGKTYRDVYVGQHSTTDNRKILQCKKCTYESYDVAAMRKHAKKSTFNS